MFNGRSLEFFEADNKLSMTRLLCFFSFWPATYALYIIRTENALLYYLGAFVLGYIGGKSAEAWGSKTPLQPGSITETKTKTTEVTPPLTPPLSMAELPVKDMQVKDMQVNVAGDVTLNKDSDNG